MVARRFRPGEVSAVLHELHASHTPLNTLKANRVSQQRMLTKVSRFHCVVPSLSSRTREHSMKRRALIVRTLLIAALMALGWFGYAAYQKSQIKPLAFHTSPVERGELRSSVSASGTLSPVVAVNVGAQVSGRILELHADFNSEVEAGQLLAKIDPSVYLASVEQNEARNASAAAQYREAQANAQLKRRQVERIRELAQRNLIAPSELDTAEAELSVAEARVAAARASQQEAKASLAQARSNLEFTEIYSPVSGVVLSREVDVGQSVSANFETPTIFQIAEDLRVMQVNSSVTEADIGQLQKGMKARFTVDAWPDRTFHGTVREVRLMPEEVSNVVTYDAVIDVANEERLLLPGMTATIDFVLEEREDALMIPNAALRFQAPVDLHCDLLPAGGAPGPRLGRVSERIVWVLRDEQPLCVQIELGITDGSRTEVVTGDLQATDGAITGIQGPSPSGGPGPRGMRVL